MKKIIFLLTLIVLVFLLGKNLNPLNNDMFTFHDETQPARIQQFVLNLKQFKLPPRLAPDFSFKLGYPIFNFYAPTAYWITGLINISGIDIINSIKISFALSLILAFVFTFIFLSIYFDFYAALFGAIVYVTSLYFAIDIVVRGNLAETWFLTLMPLSFYFLHQNSQRLNRSTFLVTIIILFLILTTHNILSLFYLPIIFVFILLLKNKLRNLCAVFISLLLGSYFFLPLVFETSLTYATQVAKLTNFVDHFLCPIQLWQGAWGYGGSAVGCINDGMAFKIGKPQIIFFFLGTILFTFNLISKKNNKSKNVNIFFIFLTFLSLFLTTYFSQFIWLLFPSITSIVQFPWRFIAFSLLGISFLSAYFVNNLPKYFSKIFLVIGLIIIVINSKFFYKQPILKQDFINSYLSKDYIEQVVAYKVAEYLPISANYQYWRIFNKDTINYQQLIDNVNNLPLKVMINDPFNKEIKVLSPGQVFINIHYFPYWQIFINDKLLIPKQFDQLGRPIIDLQKPASIKIIYQQTLIEQFGNMLTLITIIILVFIYSNKTLWLKSKTNK